MNNNVSSFLSAETSNLYASLSNIVNRKNIINVGIITKVIDENFVNVKLYYTDTESVPVIISSVRLLHIGTAKCKINIQPAVGDNVLLFASKDFIENLEYQHEPKEKEIAIEPYDNTTIQGVLISPEGRDNAKVTIKIDEEGSITLKTEKDISVNAKGNASVIAEGDVTVESKNNATVKSQHTKFTGGNVEIGGNVTPTGQGSLCCLNFCAYNGALQTGSIAQNT